MVVTCVVDVVKDLNFYFFLILLTLEEHVCNSDFIEFCGLFSLEVHVFTACVAVF